MASETLPARIATARSWVVRVIGVSLMPFRGSMFRTLGEVPNRFCATFHIIGAGVITAVIDLGPSPNLGAHLDVVEAPRAAGVALVERFRGSVGEAIGIVCRPERSEAPDREWLAVHVRHDEETVLAHVGHR